MLYVIVCVVKGEAGEFNNQMRKEVKDKLNARSSKLPAHFTIKAPFEYDQPITELEQVLEQFSKEEKAQPFRLEGYGHFGDRVVFMDVKMSEAAKEVHDRLIDVMSKVPYISFDKKDGKNKNFHVTVASKRIQQVFDKVWDYAVNMPYDFDCMFDNISLYKWENNTWILKHEYILEQ